MKRSTLALLLFTSMGLAHAGDPVAGQAKAASCFGCHGADGNSAVAIWPKLAGQQPSYTVRQLALFKSGERQDATMQAMAAPLSEQDMKDIAAYFASQTVTSAATDPDQAARGEVIYQQGIAEKGVLACMACHRADGQGMPGEMFPALRGQHVDYLISEVRAFRDGTRTTDSGRMMRDIVTNMSDDEIVAVAHYLGAME